MNRQTQWLPAAERRANCLLRVRASLAKLKL